jgi:pilus assembly protein CpaE
MLLATVSSDLGFDRDVRAALDGRLRFEGAWDLTYEDAARLRSLAPEEKCILVVDFEDPARALPVVRSVDGRPQIATIAVGGGGTREELLQLMQCGVRDVLPSFSYREILEAVNRAAASLAGAGELMADLAVFVPAKPGCGATTLATYATAMAASLSSEPALLLDFDIRLGVTSFLLKSEGAHTIVDALVAANRLDKDLWETLVAQHGNLHLLGSGPVDFSRPFPNERFTELLDFAMRQYSLVSVDLPGSMEDFENETLLRAKHIYLVSSADIGALHLARRKAAWLQDLRLTDRVSLILNSMERRSALSVADIERIIQLPVRHLLPSAAKELARAAQAGAVLDGSSPLGKQIASIASEMAPSRPPKKKNPVRRFVDYFSVSAARS